MFGFFTLYIDNVNNLCAYCLMQIIIGSEIALFKCRIFKFKYLRKLVYESFYYPL